MTPKTKMNITTKILNPKAKIPRRESRNSANHILFACLDKRIAIHPGEKVIVGTGVSLRLPEGLAGVIHPDAALTNPWHIGMLPYRPVIDWEDEDEIRIMLINYGTDLYFLEPGTPIATIMFTLYCNVKIEQEK